MYGSCSLERASQRDTLHSTEGLRGWGHLGLSPRGRLPPSVRVETSAALVCLVALGDRGRFVCVCDHGVGVV